jgi:hypothetical protein
MVESVMLIHEDESTALHIENVSKFTSDRDKENDRELGTENFS